MNVLGRFEATLQGIVEGSFGRVFRSRLHPVEVSKKLQRAMDQNLSISAGQHTAPNVYEVSLSPRDHEQFMANTRAFVPQFQNDLIALARARGYTLTTRPIVVFHEDKHLITGEARIDARLAEPQDSVAVSGATAAEGVLDQTRELGPAERQQLAQELAQTQAQAAPEAMPQAWLILRRPNGGGQVFRLDRPLIHVGRHAGNEVVVNDRRVSRYHAEIRYERGQFVLYDLGSLNGVGVNGVLTHGPIILRNNDQVSVGNHDFIFQRR
jgi:hypothetical protein